MYNGDVWTGDAGGMVERMIRKQLYLAQEQERKLGRLAERWQCTEAEVIRAALDRMPDPDLSIDSLLTDAGLLIPPPVEADLPTGEAGKELEQADDAWLATQARPLHLAEAVLEDRR
jgi:hypothetical protein